jgi:hypothetical protein
MFKHFKNEFFHITLMSFVFLSLMLVTPVMAATTAQQDISIKFESEIIIPNSITISVPSTYDITLPRTAGNVDATVGNLEVSTNKDFPYVVNVKTDTPCATAVTGLGSLYNPLKVKDFNGELQPFSATGGIGNNIKLFESSIGGNNFLPIEIQIPVTNDDLPYIKDYHIVLTYSAYEM